MTDDRYHRVIYNDGTVDHTLGAGNPDVATGQPDPIVYSSADGNLLLFPYSAPPQKGLLVDMAKLTAADADLNNVAFFKSPSVRTTSFDGRFTATLANAVQLWNGTLTMTVTGRSKADIELAIHCGFSGQDTGVTYNVALHLEQGGAFIDMNGTASISLQWASGR
jgi:hypothetical protein